MRVPMDTPGTGSGSRQLDFWGPGAQCRLQVSLVGSGFPRAGWGAPSLAHSLSLPVKSWQTVELRGTFWG